MVVLSQMACVPVFPLSQHSHAHLYVCSRALAIADFQTVELASTLAAASGTMHGMKDAEVRIEHANSQTPTRFFFLFFLVL